MRPERLDEDNYMLYAAKYYDNPACFDVCEFVEDLKRIKYIKKALTRYEQTGEVKVQLILNHLTVLLNVFGPRALPRMLFLKLGEKVSYMRPFMEQLGIWPTWVMNIGKEGRDFDTSGILGDAVLAQGLRSIRCV